jgi:hypothetical protein
MLGEGRIYTEGSSIKTLDERPITKYPGEMKSVM